MFSAASFGAILDAQRPGDRLHERAPIPKCPVVAFYGFRGGSGRTTALTHVAATFANRGSTVVAVDLDLEAPGLSTVLRCEDIDEATGALALLRIAEQVELADDERLRIAPHLVSGDPALPPVRVIPAGKLSASYYAALDLLNPSLWHVMEGPSPLRMLLDRIRREITPDVILVDCRTGLAPLSAAAIFHESDVVVAAFSATRQSHAGACAVIEMLRAAQSRRGGRPSSLLVPTMFSESDEGIQRREELLDVLDDAIETSGHLGDVEDADLLDDPIVVVRDGIPFRTSLSVTDVLSSNYHHVAGGAYEPLLAKLDSLLGTPEVQDSVSQKHPKFNPRTVLEQLDNSIAQLAFAENVAPADVEKWFLQPTALRSILAASTFYIVGAKGSGKSWLYKRMVSGKQPLDIEQVFLHGHGPINHAQQDSDFSSEAFKGLDRHFRKSKPGFEPSFWRLRAVGSLARHMTKGELQAFKASLTVAERKAFAPLSTHGPLFDGVVAALKTEGAEKLSEQLLRRVDDALASQIGSRHVLVYDGLDTGFGSADPDLERRKRFVSGLVDALEGVRGRLNAVGFKVLLREDVFSQLEVQNKSHLRTATVELVWRPVDAWKLALNVAVRSNEYENVVRNLDSTVTIGTWPDDEERLVRLLNPLWGARMEKGQKISTATFVQRRTADGQGRLFPRTVIELLKSAVSYELSRGHFPADRVLSSAALQESYREASRLRLADLEAEYKETSPYLATLKGMNPTATRKQLITIMQNKTRREGAKRQGRGVPAGALQAGPGGWNKVVDRLLEIGVLKEYKRATGESGEPKYEVALLYRPALGVKLVGV